MRNNLFFKLFILFPLLIISFNTWAVNYCSNSDTTKNAVKPKVKHKAPIEAKVIYHARDSIRFDATTKKVFLYGEASVKYEDLELKAAYIDISMDSNIALAHGVVDSGKTVGSPEFHQGSDVFYATQMRYNFRSKKGRINNIRTKEGEGYITGKVVKKDSDGVYYLKDGNYSTCSKDSDKDFYIGAVKLKVIPHNQVVTGPAWLVVEGVPTPLAIPFGFFPLQQGRHSGILIPAYGESQSQGFYLQNGGYYLGLNDHFDMQLRGDIYSYGSWAARDIINYDNRYHYHGSLNFGYALTLLPVEGTAYSAKQRTFNISWNDQQDPKARPNSTFMASVNAGSSNYYTNTSYNPATYLQNTLSSNISFSQNFQGTPFHLVASADHSQNTINHTVNIDLPVLTFTVDRMYPAKWFSDNTASNPNKWYNNISFNITTSAENKISTLDSLLFKPKTLRQMQNGITSNIPLSANFRVFRYFTLTPGVSFTSTEYFQTIRKSWNSIKDSIMVDTVQGIQSANTYNASASLNTSVYSLYSIGVHRAITIRHVMYPTIGFSYHPDFSSAPFNYYRTIQYNESGATTKYSIFQNGIYGGPGTGRQEAIVMSLGNNLEMKIRQKTDSGMTYKKIKLIERFTISTSYNMVADSFKQAYISVSGNTTLFKILAVNYSGTIDPYKMQENGDNINHLMWQENKLGRFVDNSLTLSTSLAPGTFAQSSTQKQGGNKDNSSGLKFTSPNDYFQYISNHPAYYAPLELSSWSVTLNYSISSSFEPGPNKNITTQGLMINMSAQVTKYWHASIFSGYDFTYHQFTATQISATRDMHCWEMVFSSIPFGFHQNFSVELHVKYSVLHDLKITRKRDWYDTQQYQQ